MWLLAEALEGVFSQLLEGLLAKAPKWVRVGFTALMLMIVIGLLAWAILG
jgi:hypothetical protein